MQTHYKAVSVETSEMRQSLPLSIIVCAEGSGYHAEVVGLKNQLDAIHQACAELLDKIELTIIASGEQWSHSPIIEISHATFPNLSVIDGGRYGEEVGDLRRAIATAAGRRIILIDNQLEIDKDALNAVSRACIGREESDSCLIAAPVEATRKLHLPDATPDRLYQLLSSSPIMGTHAIAVPRLVASRILGEDTNLLVSRSISRTFIQSAIYSAPCEIVTDCADVRSTKRCSSSPITEDLLSRFAFRARETPGNVDSFISDLPLPDRKYLARKLGKAGLILADEKSEPIKVTVLTNPWDYHHNWLCFFSLFQSMEGSGFGTVRAVFESEVTREHIIDCDLLILSRSRTDRVGLILSWCEEVGTASLYMLDDNWLTIGKDWPVLYGAQFGPDSQIIRNMKEATSRSTASLVYNRLLAEDLGAFAKRVVTLPNSVDIDRFREFARPEKSNLVLGYAGSARIGSEAFQALINVSSRVPASEIFVMGDVLPEHRQLLTRDNVTHIGPQTYTKYIQTIRKSGVDILTAPLDPSRTSKSKCPNKYLEITAAGAVGVYSNVEPYSWHVRDGENGVLVGEDGTVADWERAIERLLDKTAREKMLERATDDVRQNHSLPVVAKQFSRLLHEVIRLEKGL